MVNLKSSLLSASLSISAVMTTLISTLVSTTASATEVNQATIDAVKDKIVASCPVRWEDHSKSLVLPTLASDDIWENADDRSAFVAYITDVLTELGSSNSADDLANDVNTVAAECATHRTALLDLLLVKEPNDLVLSMRAMKRNLDELAAAGSDGASRETAAKDCKAIKTAFPESEDGAYWIDVNGGSSNDAIEVFCDMTSDGGGWTFVAFYADKALNEPVEMLSFFNTAVGDYQVSRVATADHYSLGILPELQDTEMMMVALNSDPAVAISLKSFSQLRYKSTAPAFNFGPLPCSPSGFEFRSYRTNFEYVAGYMDSAGCDDLRWVLKAYTNKGDTNRVNYMYKTYSNVRFYGWTTDSTTYKAHKKTWFYVR